MKLIWFPLFRLAATFLLLLPLPPICFAARGDNDLKMDRGSEKMANSPDVAFLIKAVQSGTGQEQLGKLASMKATSPGVKSLGSQLAEENGTINYQLISFAAHLLMTLPGTMNVRDQAVYYKLQNDSGVSFDKTYLKAMVKDRKSDIKLFRKEAKKGRDKQIQRFASATLAMLHDQLTHIQSLHASAKVGKSPGGR